MENKQITTEENPATAYETQADNQQELKLEEINAITDKVQQELKLKEIDAITDNELKEPQETVDNNKPTKQQELTSEETHEAITNNQAENQQELKPEEIDAITDNELKEPQETVDNNKPTKQQKLTPKEVKAARKKSIFRFIKYALIAASAGIIQIVSYIILSDLIKLDKHVSFDAIYQKQPWLTEIFYDPESGKTYGLSYFIALTLSVIWNFTFNRKYTFKSASNVPKAMLLVALYYLVFTPLSCWWLVQLNKKMTFKFADKLVLVMTMLINFITEFLYQRFVVFRKSIDTSVDKKKKNNQSSKKI